MKHIQFNGNLINVKKTWKHLSSKQRNWIYDQLRNEYIACCRYHDRHPGKEQYNAIVQNVYVQICERKIWIPYHEIRKVFQSKLSRYQKIKIEDIAV